MTHYDNKKYNLSVLAIFKNEMMNLKVWLDHYLKQGVNHFYLIDNDSNDNPMNLLDDYINKGLVTYIFTSGKHRQVEYYRNVFKKYNLNQTTKWLAVCDIDEFYFGTNKKLSDFLKDNEAKYDVIKSNWLMFGSSNFINHPDNILTSMCYRSNLIHPNTKYIFKTSSLQNINSIDSIDIHELKGFQPLSHILMENNLIHLNHYPIQSVEYFQKIKMTRGACDWIGHENVRDMEYFKSYDDNSILDTTLKNLIISGYNY